MTSACLAIELREELKYDSMRKRDGISFGKKKSIRYRIPGYRVSSVRCTNKGHDLRCSFHQASSITSEVLDCTDIGKMHYKFINRRAHRGGKYV